MINFEIGRYEYLCYEVDVYILQIVSKYYVFLELILREFKYIVIIVLRSDGMGVSSYVIYRCLFLFVGLDKLGKLGKLLFDFLSKFELDFFLSGFQLLIVGYFRLSVQFFILSFEEIVIS